jgi:ribonuclease PH
LKRKGNRKYDEIRGVKFLVDYLEHPLSSCLIETGNTKVLCSVFQENKVPPFLKGSGMGWITAEYGMLPGSTEKRTVRERNYGKIYGRNQEIQRLIGRALRAMIDLKKVGEITFYVDCDVIQADGGTRTASINAGAVALALAVRKLIFKSFFIKNPLIQIVSAISVGVVKGEKIIDLNFEEDSIADIDMNIVEADENKIIEIQGTGERDFFSLEDLQELVLLSQKGISEIRNLQKEAIENGYEKFIKNS